MKLKDKIVKALNKQINAELYSAYLYLGMSVYFELVNLKGFAHWMRVQTKEEQRHAMKIYEYLLERGGVVALDVIDKPPANWNSPQQVFEAAHEHETKVSAMIDELYNLAAAEKDNATSTMLQWFITEQVEEEASTEEIAHKLKLIGNEGPALLMLDRDLAARKPEPEDDSA